MARTKGDKAQRCGWWPDGEGSDVWVASCQDSRSGQLFQFNDDGPLKNGFKFCPYFGRPLKEDA